MIEVINYGLPLVAILLAVWNLWFLFARHRKLQRECEKLERLLLEQNEIMGNLLKQIDKALEKEQEPEKEEK
nr:MAG TPA: Heme exporter protein D (CcmD) [Caudoviricetes sp.]